MTQADSIREYAYQHYVLPARTRGQRTVVIRSGDVHSEMGLRSAMPAVCSALGANKFEERYRVRKLKAEGPAVGANLYLTFQV
jgi:5-methylcytosine-specific restriction protein B